MHGAAHQPIAAQCPARLCCVARELARAGRNGKATMKKRAQTGFAVCLGLALAWVLSKPFVTSPIVGASKPHHLDDAIAALSLKLDERTIKRLEEPYRPRGVVGFS